MKVFCLFLFLFTSLFTVGCNNNEPTMEELRQGFMQEFHKQVDMRGNGQVVNLDIRRVRKGTYTIECTVMRYHDRARRTLTGSARVDSNGDVMFYMN